MAERILIDRGHGGSDPGAVKYVREVDITHAWGAELDAQIKRLGGDSYVLQDGADANSDLSVPVNEANNYGKPWLFISIHANAGGGTGYETYIYSGAWNNASTADLGHGVHNSYGAVAQKYGLANRGLKKGDFYVIRETRNRACLLELAFVDSQKDADLMKNVTFRAEACEALARALMKEAGQTIKEPAKPVDPPKPVAEPAKYPLPAESKRLKLESGRVKLVNMASKTVLDCSMSKKTAHGWEDNGQTQQLPYWDEKTRRLMVKIEGKDYALDAVAQKNNTQAIWYDKPHSGQLEQWFLEYIKTTTGGIDVVRIINVYTGRALDLHQGLKTNGAAVTTWKPANSDIHYWMVNKIKQ